MNAQQIPLRVVKVGGSLLTWPELSSALTNWLAMQPPAIHILICGGGPFADVIRQSDRIFALGEETSHWLAIGALAATSRLLAALLPNNQFLTTYSALIDSIRRGQPQLIVFNPHEFLESHESRLPGTVLPHSWQVTTDSIAARLAETLAADELTLLKSIDPPAGDHAALAAAGYLDSFFPQIAPALRSIRLVNLRASPGS